MSRLSRQTVSQRVIPHAECARLAGFSLLELVVTIAILGVLAAILLPAIMQSRAAAQHVVCQSNLRQVMLAVSNYESVWSVYPNGRAWRYDLLPQLEQQALYDAKLPDDPTDMFAAWRPIEEARLPVYACPADPDIGVSRLGMASYVGCYGSGVLFDGYNGIFTHWMQSYPDLRPIRPADVTDGLSNTAALSEFLVANGDINATRRTIYFTPRSYGVTERDAFVNFCERIPPNPTDYGYLGDHLSRGRPWYMGAHGMGMYNHTLRPNQLSCFNAGNPQSGIHTAASLHVGGVNVAYSDGRVEFVSQTIDLAVWRETASRAQRVASAP